MLRPQVIGYYSNEVDAARARDMAAIALLGTPRLNFPPSQYTRRQVMATAATLVHRYPTQLPAEIKQMVERNVRNWEGKLKGLKVKGPNYIGPASPAVRAKPAAAAGAAGARAATPLAPSLPPGYVQVRLRVEAGGAVRVQLVVVTRSTAAGGGAQAQSTRAALSQRLVAKAQQPASPEDSRVPNSRRKQSRPQVRAPPTAQARLCVCGAEALTQSVFLTLCLTPAEWRHLAERCHGPRVPSLRAR